MALVCVAVDAGRSLACVSIESRRDLVVALDGPLFSRDPGGRTFRDTLWVADAGDLDRLCGRDGFPAAGVEQERMEANPNLTIIQRS